MNIDRVTEFDLPELAKLYAEFWNEPSSVDKMKETFRRIGDDERYQILVARLNGRIVGTLLGVFCENLYGNCNPFLVIEDVIVSKQHRRTGVGTMLMKKIEETARSKNCENILFVTESNRDDAVSFYTALGFEHDKYCGFKKRVR